MSWRCQWWMTYLFNDTEWRPLMDLPFQQLQQFGLPHCNKDSYSDFVCPVHQWLQWWGLCSTSQQDYGRERIVGDRQQQKMEQWSSDLCFSSYTWGIYLLLQDCSQLSTHKVFFSGKHMVNQYAAYVCLWQTTNLKGGTYCLALAILLSILLPAKNVISPIAVRYFSVWNIF